MNEFILVRDEPPGDENALAAIRDGIARLADMAGAFIFSHGEEVSESANHYLWFGPLAGDEIAVVDDFSISVRYIAARARIASRATQLAEALRTVVDHVPVAELRSRARMHAHDDPAALVRLALPLRSFDAELKEVFTQALSSPSEPVRYHAVMAASLLRWPELLPEVRLLLGSDQDESLRRLASHAMQVCTPRAPE